MAEAGENPAYTMRQIGHSEGDLHAGGLHGRALFAARPGSGPIGSMLQASEVAHNGANDAEGEIDAPPAGGPRAESRSLSGI